nr:hypothetical protein GCM10020092_036910 [Actinoplanes digitatis]
MVSHDGGASGGQDDSLFGTGIQQLIGMNVKEVVTRAGSFVIIDLVGPELPTRPLLDTAVLWIYMSAWRIDVEGYPVVGHEDARSDIREAVSLLGDRVLTGLEVDPGAIDATFRFGSISLKVFFPCGSLYPRTVPVK